MTTEVEINWQAEEAIVGILLAHPTMIVETEGMVRKGDFKDLPVANIYSVISKMAADGKAINNATSLTASLKSYGVVTETGAVTPSRIIELREIGESFDAEQAKKALLEHIYTVVKSSQADRLLLAGASIERLLKTSSPAQAIGQLRKAIDDIENRGGVEVVPLYNTNVRLAKELRKKAREVGSDTLSPIGLEPFDSDAGTGGMAKGEYGVFAAESGAGKTAAAMVMARQRALAGYRTLFVSLEMLEEQVFHRSMAQETMDISVTHLRKPRMLSDAHLLRIDNTSKAAKHTQLIDVIYAPDRTIGDVCAMIRSACLRSEYSLVIVDYLTNFHSTKPPREHAMECSARLRGLAKSSGVPLIALAQLSRAIAKDGKRRHPTRADIAESKTIFDDSDYVFLFSRSIEENANPNLYLVNMEKVRQGQQYTFDCLFHKSSMTMTFGQVNVYQ